MLNRLQTKDLRAVLLMHTISLLKEFFEVPLLFNLWFTFSNMRERPLEGGSQETLVCSVRNNICMQLLSKRLILHCSNEL